MYVGDAFDIAGERRQVNYTQNGNEATESFEIKVRNHKTAAAEMFALSLKLPMQTSSSSSNEQKTRERSRPTVFETMSSNGDSIMGVA